MYTFLYIYNNHNQAAQALTGSGGTKADYLSAGRAFELNRDWSGAIDAYLKVDPLF